MPQVEGGDLVNVQPLGQSDYRRITRPERQIRVALHQLGHSSIVGADQLDGFKVAVGEGDQKGRLGGRTGFVRYQVSDSATTGAGTSIGRLAKCRPVNRSTHRRWSGSLDSAAETSGPVSQTITLATEALAEKILAAGPHIRAIARGDAKPSWRPRTVAHELEPSPYFSQRRWHLIFGKFPDQADQLVTRSAHTKSVRITGRGCGVRCGRW